MLNKEEFARLHADFIKSQQVVEIAHWNHRGLDFVCHHNAYLVARFLQDMGHEDLHWVTGYYQCYKPKRQIHHSWIKIARAGSTVAIFEFDPRQLYERGGYEDDLMPSGNIPEFCITISGVACIVDPDLVELPTEAMQSPWVVSSKEVLLRYVENSDLKPDLDFAELDWIGSDAREEFDLLHQFWEDAEE